MKKIIFMLLLFECVVLTTSAQDFAPGQQAQGLLESKNVTVDYATGIFHYKVPLYTLKSGDYELPISLDYTGKGVKVEDQPGLVGYNWTLNTGGVVTRTVRGGVADEDYLYGYIWREEDATPLREDTTKVHLHQRDGECDIFTAAFGGQSVRFIIRKNSDGMIVAEPMERTNARIECIQSTLFGNREIEGWIVTDASGNRYTFNQKEYIKDVSAEGAVSFNDVREGTYISSWYLSKIEPLNSPAILFDYMEEVLPNEDSNNVLSVVYGASREMTYKYGKPWVERNFNFAPYKEEFEKIIAIAEAYFQVYGFTRQAEIKMFDFSNQGRWVENPSFGKDVESLRTHYRVCGHLADFKKISKASVAVIEELDHLIGLYKDDTDTNIRMGISALGAARNLVIDCFNKKNTTTERTVTDGFSYTVCSPLLRSISCMGEKLVFDCWIDVNGYSGHLLSVKMKRQDGSSVSQKELNYGASWALSQVVSQDSTGRELSSLEFEYYPEPQPGSDSIPDNFGCCQRSYMLKTISCPEGGELRMDYEPNQVKRTNTPGIVYQPVNAVTAMTYGGMRLRSLITKDANQVKADTIEYRYPLLGSPLCNYTDWRRLDYQGFHDLVHYSRCKKYVYGYQASGNDGVFYPYVQEWIKGKGCRAYYFTAPFLSQTKYPPCYWTYGLPLATVVYDEQKNVRQITRNEYYMSGMTLEIGVWGTDYFFASEPSFLYTKNLPQLGTEEYYMNADQLSAYYRKQGITHLYEKISFDPYKEVFQENILPRTGYTGSMYFYDLWYGGKVLLKAQKEYRFDGHVTDSIGYGDARDLSKNRKPYLQTEYEYGNPEHSILPTCIRQVYSDGRTHRVEMKRATEMDLPADTVVAAMLSKNMLAQIVKQSEWQGDTLINETVNRYETLVTPNSSCVCLAEESRYVPSAVVTGLPVKADTAWYRYGKDAYQVLKSSTYTLGSRKECLPAKVEVPSGNTVFLYNYVNDRTILKAGQVSRCQVAAFDSRDDEGLSDNTFDLFEIAMRLCREFRKVYAGINLATLNGDIVSYLQSERHQKALRLIDMVATDSYPEDSTVFKNMVDSIVNENVMEEFRYMYMQVIIRRCPVLMEAQAYNWINSLCSFLSQPVEDKRSIYHYAYSEVNRFLFASEKEIAIVPKSAHIRLYTLFYDYYNHFSYQVKYKDGTFVDKTLSVNTVISNHSGTPYAFGMVDLELENVEDIDSLVVSPRQDFCVFWVLVPQETVFEATSYKADGTVLARFDQTGTLEFYEYDAAGRQTRITDGKGHVLKTSRYNTANH